MALTQKKINIRVLDRHPVLGVEFMKYFKQIDHFECTFVENTDFPIIDAAVMSVYTDITGGHKNAVKPVINLTIGTLIEVPFHGIMHRVSGYCTAKLECQGTKLFAIQQYDYGGLMDAETSVPLNSPHNDFATYCYEKLILTQLGRPVAGHAVMKKTR